MKIIHITAGIQETCGVSQFVVNIAREQQVAGHEVTIVTRMTCGYPVDDLKVVLASDPVATLDSISSQISPVVHLHSMWNSYVHKAAVWCRTHGVPYICSPHGATTPWAMHYKWWKKIPAWRLYQRHDFKCAAAFHVTVKDEEDDVRRLGFKQPVVIAPLGADVGMGRFEKCERCRDVVFISRIHPKKNVPSLIRAWSILRSRPTPTPIVYPFTPRLIIAGSDDVGHQEELVELAKSLGLRVVDFSKGLEFGKKQISGGGEVPVETFQERLADCDADVVFAGPVYAAAKDWMYAHAWVTVLPSHSENFGSVVIESLAQGTPVVASTGTPWRALEEWKCGRWIEPTSEKIAEVLSEMLTISEKERESMSMAARELVGQKYSWKASAAKVVEQYEKVLQSERGMAV